MNRQVKIITPAMATQQCLRPTCNAMAVSRGLCKSCLNAASYLVNTGQTTWEELEAKGKVFPKRRPRDERTSWFLDDDESSV